MLRYRPGVALIVVDVQNDFADPNGSLSVKGGAEVIPTINGQVELARNNGALVVATQDWHPEHTPHFAKDGGIWPDHCVQDTWGAQLHPDLELHDDTRIVRKGTNGEDGYSAFTMRDPVSGETIPTELGQVLKDADIEEVVVTGLATDYCVRATALDSADLGFHTYLLTDACAGVNLNPGDGDAAIAEMEAKGIHLSNTRVR
ncbi:MAG TPA: isochorismatase family protein [Candidatus Limnocylindrales bacterium]|jgi:nicotinamidase/pyrazinamidase|nr:isochorismatase family protein [Candidatus Limnocylindrales bacterium]